MIWNEGLALRMMKVLTERLCHKIITKYRIQSLSSQQTLPLDHGVAGISFTVNTFSVVSTLYIDKTKVSCRLGRVLDSMYEETSSYCFW